MSRSAFRHLAWILPVAVVGCPALPRGADDTPSPAAGQPQGAITEEQILRGRQLVISGDCGGCHGGSANPVAEDWLIGLREVPPDFRMGEYFAAPANLTPDTETGAGRWTDRQLFNALRYGLRPSATPDILVTSSTPGVGNHPARPNYLAPLMPWATLRHMSDQELWDIIAYLRHLQPVRAVVPEGRHPADNWASAHRLAKIGPMPVAGFPTATEELRDPARRTQVLQGRQLVVRLGCGLCHGGQSDPSSSRWMRGILPEAERGGEGPFEIAFPLELPFGRFTTYPRNLTPDNVTGLGRFSERQLFNALRFGLRPGETADVEITSDVPGQGNFPASPKYLAPPMPWPGWRHLRDDQLWAIVAYLKNGLKPARNLVQDSEGPPDFWAGLYGSGMAGTYPAPPFPTARERAP
ncbi:MAG: cytochrome c [Gemmatimonadales bacterium]